MSTNDIACLFDQAAEDTRREGTAQGADLDVGKYRPFLDGFDLTDKQASELIRVVWSIMRMWVEMDLPADSCGQIVERLIDPAVEESGGLD